MKHLKITTLCLVVLAVFVTASSFTSNKSSTENGLKTVTYSELKAAYGEHIFDAQGNAISMNESDVISFQGSMNAKGNPACGGVPPCGTEQGYIRGVLTQQANDCCCSFTYGVECCQQGNLVAILYLISPTDPSCN